MSNYYRFLICVFVWSSGIALFANETKVKPKAIKFFQPVQFYDDVEVKKNGFLQDLNAIKKRVAALEKSSKTFQDETSNDLKLAQTQIEVLNRHAEVAEKAVNIFNKRLNSMQRLSIFANEEFLQTQVKKAAHWTGGKYTMIIDTDSGDERAFNIVKMAFSTQLAIEFAKQWVESGEEELGVRLLTIAASTTYKESKGKSPRTLIVKDESGNQVKVKSWDYYDVENALKK